jgi:two-component system chemotaxis response regulator CheY
MITSDKNLKILIVDDMMNMRRTLNNMLRYIGYTFIEEAIDGDIALQMMKKNPPDLVITDWNMPRMPGIELVRKARENEQFSNTPFLMVTAEVQESHIVQAAESDIDGYIIKPFVAKTLQTKIDTILGKRKSPTELDQLIKKGINLRNEKKYENAIATFKEALKVVNKSARIWHLIGETFQLKGDLKKAEKFFQEAVKNNPLYVKVHHSLGDLYQKTGEDEKAFVALEKAIKISPNNVFRQLALGKIYLAKGKIIEADKVFKKALQVGSKDSLVLKTIGEIYLEGGHSEKAASAFKESLNLKKEVAVYKLLGIALERSGKAFEAIGQFNKALLLDPNDAALYFNIGRAYSESNEKEKALQFFKKTLEVDPNFKDAKIILEQLETKL